VTAHDEAHAHGSTGLALAALTAARLARLRGFLLAVAAIVAVLHLAAARGRPPRA
jgi:hypothetical protein